MIRRERLLTGVLCVAIAFVLSFQSTTPVSSCSLNSIPEWLKVVLDRGLAVLNPDCTLTWKTGVVTDLDGNIIYPSPNQPQLMVQFGIALFLAGGFLIIIGGLLMFKARHLMQAGKKPVVSSPFSPSIFEMDLL